MAEPTVPKAATTPVAPAAPKPETPKPVAEGEPEEPDVSAASINTRSTYRELSDTEKSIIGIGKDYGNGFLKLLDQADANHMTNNSRPSRELELSRQKMEEAVMWFVKGVTG